MPRVDSPIAPGSAEQEVIAPKPKGSRRKEERHHSFAIDFLGGG
jgi:hypothetical protein